MVDYNRRKRLDTSRIRDRRGSGGGGGGRGVAIGGAGGLVLIVLALLTGVDPGALLSSDPGTGQAPAAEGEGLAACEVGADVATDRDCRFVVFENSIQEYWDDVFAASGSSYSPATLTTFTGGVSTGCGQASSSTGPFYCPPDRGVYLDLGFFDVLEQQLGATGGDFAEAYVLAHEFGHHVQNVTGQMERVRTRQGEDSDAVRLELQADCYAGMWAGQATEPGPGGEEPALTAITSEDVANAIDAAETVGDDYIQQRTQGSVSPESFTHGTSEQRRRWFRTGFESGDPEACDTFDAASL